MSTGTQVAFKGKEPMKKFCSAKNHSPTPSHFLFCFYSPSELSCCGLNRYIPLIGHCFGFVSGSSVAIQKVPFKSLTKPSLTL